MKFKYSNSNKRYYTLDYFYKEKFKKKVAKIPLDASFTCPNIDGSKGYGGCTFCYKGSSSNLKYQSLLEQFEEEKEKIKDKWKDTYYIAYFQAHTNTYDSVNNLKKLFEPFLTLPDVVGLTIGTRPDSISEECFDYLEDLNKRTYLTVELGLQTIHDKTEKYLNRCYTKEEFEKCFQELKRRKINTVVHIINGLPYETKEDMLKTVKYLDSLGIRGIKIHMLFINKETKMEKIYKEKNFPLLSRDEYLDILVEELEILNENCVIHRVTGDPLKEELVAPSWVLDKVDVLNHLDILMEKRNVIEGMKHSILNYVHQEIDKHVRYDSNVIDATLGNGKDTLYLSNIINKGHIFCFDIQEEAIKRSKELLKDKNNITYFLKSHSEMAKTLPKYKKKISLVLFNLGYLPRGNKEITTKKETTLKALQESFLMLNKRGMILIVIYKHEEGKEEEKGILSLLKGKDYKYQIIRNTDNIDAPYLIKIINY